MPIREMVKSPGEPAQEHGGSLLTGGDVPTGCPGGVLSGAPSPWDSSAALGSAHPATLGR